MLKKRGMRGEKVLKDRRSPRGCSRMGTSVRNTRLASFSANVSTPLSDTSMPLTAYGKSINFVPFFASCSMLYPGDGSLLRPISRANLSRQFPTAMSIVSPKMRYLCGNKREGEDAIGQEHAT